MWELEDGLDVSRQSGRPHVLIYRRMPPKPIELTEPDADERYTQYRRVEAYFGNFADPATGIISTAFSIYEKPDDFRQRIESDVRTLVKEVLDGDTAAPLPEPTRRPAPAGRARRSPASVRSRRLTLRSSSAEDGRPTCSRAACRRARSWR